MRDNCTERTPWGLEYTVSECPRRHFAEVSATFPGIDRQGLLVALTCQHSELDLVSIGDAIEAEKDRLLEKFCQFADKVCRSLEADGIWTDYIDPCSGLPMIHRDSTTPYDEVDGFATLLRYQTSTAGPCKILLHPEWGSSIYPASIFAITSKERFSQALRQAGN